MKKKLNVMSIFDMGTNEILLKMKLLTLLMFTAFVSASASSYSQATKFNLMMKDVTISDVFQRIEEQSEFVILFNEKTLNVRRKVDVSVKDETVDKILDQIFRGDKDAYKILDRQIAIYPNEIRESAYSINIESNTEQQKKEISGTVKDSKGIPLSGVSVVVKGTTIGNVTDSDGKFRISIPLDAKTLAFSFVGMKTQEIIIGNNTTISVTLTEEVVGIDEIVAIGYGTQNRSTLTGSISSLKGETMSLTPMASTSNLLAGQLPGLISQQLSGQPGADAATLSIRGFGSPLVIVDGIETGFNTIDPNEIETVSILKDGASSIYGSRAGNGVILITTKRGNLGKPTITLNSSFTVQGITNFPKPASSGQYTEMRSEAYLQSGQDPSNVPYTPAQIASYKAGNNPNYPNTNWFNAIVRDWAPQQQTNLSIKGGTDKIKYFGFFGFLNQQSMWKTSGDEYSRYNFQSNIDAKILDNLTLQLDVSSIYETALNPWRSISGGDLFSDLWNLLPIYPSSLPDPTKTPYGGSSSGANAMSNRNLAGYDDINRENLKGTLALNYTFKRIKGLSAKAFVNYMQNISFEKIFQKPLTFYTYDPDSKTYTVAATLFSQANLNQNNNEDRTITGQMSLNYDRTFGDHHITAMAVYEAIDYSDQSLSAGRINFLSPLIDQMFAGSTTNMTNSGGAGQMGRVSYIGRLNYSFKNKYLIDASFRDDASAKFPSATRWGLFPSISLGWRIGEENFMKSLDYLDNLKLRASFGKSGLDNVGGFAFLSGYSYGASYPFGGTSQNSPGLYSTGLANPTLTWENVATSNIGIDFSLWKRKLYGEADVFYRSLTGIPATRISTLPSSFGAGLPPVNINSLNDRGFELKLGTSGSKGDLSWDLSGNISWSRSKWDHYEESDYTDPDQARINTKSHQWTDRTFGYKSDGLFTSQAQIDALTFDQDGQGNKSLRPGDIRYKDLNKDGKIDWKDQAIIGKGTIPHWMMGFSPNLKYKNFSLASLFQGSFGYYTNFNFNSFNGTLTPVQVYDLRWTTANNNPNALLPRLGGAATNSYTSDYFYKKAAYLRLKSLSLGYTLPSQWVRKANLSQVKIYAAGTNLITFDKLKKFGLDPEAPSGRNGFYYPQQKTISFGASISF